jgi:DNA repair protein RadC
MKAETRHGINEKLRYGVEYLSDEELFSIITDLEPETYRKLRDSLLGAGARVCESFEAASYGEEGVTPAKALKCRAVLEIAKRMNNAKEPPANIVRGPEDIAHYLMPRFTREKKEHFMVTLLTTKNRIMGYKVISVGSLTASIVHPREVFEAATKNHAASIILAHNHPSGDPSPSKEDIAITHRLKEAGDIMDIPVLDHIIIGDGRYVSLKEKGELVA